MVQAPSGMHGTVLLNSGNLRSSLGQKFDPLEYPKIGIFDSSIKAGKMA